MSTPAVTADPQDAMTRPHAAAYEPPADAPSFREAFAAAKESHAITDVDAGDEDDTPADATTETADAKPDAKADKADTTVEAKPDAKTPETGLITDTEFTALQTKHANDPVGLKRALDKVFTQKTQALAAERKTYEKYQPYAEVIDAFETDAAGTLAQLAAQQGFELVKRDGTAAVAADAADTAEPAVDAIVEKFRERLGPELEYLADGLAPAIKGLVEEMAKTTVDQAVKPLQERESARDQKLAEELTGTVMASFTEKHPDWKEHEPAILALTAKVKLEPGTLTELEYLEQLYILATHEKTVEKRVAAGIAKELARMRKGADSAETRTMSTPEGKVTAAPSGVPTFAEAAAAARRGERWE